MSFVKVTVSDTNKQFTKIRQQFVAHFHNKEPVIILSCLPLNGRNFYNNYSSVKSCDSQLEFNLDDSNATRLVDIESNALTGSIVGKIKFHGPVQMKPYTTKAGKSRTDKMKECLISDGTTCLTITFWSDFIDLIAEDQLVQITQVYSKTIGNAITLSTDMTSGICYLTEDLECNFENLDTCALPKNSVECLQQVECIKNFEVYQCCKNCKRRLEIQSGTGLCTCQCGRVFLIDQIKSSAEWRNVSATIEFKNRDNIVLQATFFKDTLKALFTDFSLDNILFLKQQLLILKKIDLHLNTKQIVSKTEECKH